jgi:hypothetical protein
VLAQMRARLLLVVAVTLSLTGTNDGRGLPGSPFAEMMENRI